MQAQQWKLGSAAIGVSAVLAMGALGVAIGNVSSAGPGQVIGPVAPQATGQPITTTTTSEVTAATPKVTATTPSGFAPSNVVSPVTPQLSGQTITTTPPPTTPATTAAAPNVTATTPSGFAPAPRS